MTGQEAYEAALRPCPQSACSYTLVPFDRLPQHLQELWNLGRTQAIVVSVPSHIVTRIHV